MPRPPKATPAQLAERAEARKVRCEELRALSAAEAATRGGECERAGCTVKWEPGIAGGNPLQWHHGRAHVGHDYHRAISAMVSNAKTTDAELEAELKKCMLLCRAHHTDADSEIRGRNERRKRALPKGIEPADLAALLAAPNIRTVHGLRARLMLELMSGTGMRVSEVCNLTVRHLHHTEDWRIEIRASKTGDRMLYLPKRLRPLMTIWLDWRVAHFPRSKWLFPTASGGRLSRGNVAGMLDRLAYRAGIPETHPHALRHTFATEYIRNGGDAATLQQILGHTTAMMSMRYAMSSPDRVRAALEDN